MSTSGWSTLLLVVFLSGLTLGLQLDQPGPTPTLHTLPLERPSTVLPGGSSAVATSGNPFAGRAVLAEDDWADDSDWPESRPAPRPTVKSAPSAATLSAAVLPTTATVRELYQAFRKALPSKEREEARRLWRRMLDTFPHEGFTQLADAEWWHRLGRTRRALKILIDHRPMERDGDVLQVLDEHLEEWLPAYLLVLKTKADKAWYLAFLRYLIIARPTEMGYQWQLAQVLFGLKQYQETLLTLEALIYDPVLGQQALALQAKAERRLALLSAYDLELPLDRRGKSLIVKVRLNGVAAARLIVDTGAELTLLTPDAVARAGMDTANPVGEVRLTTVSGVVSAPVIEMGVGLEGVSGPHGNVAVEGGPHNVAVYASPLREGTDGLLGMDVLQGYRFFIDQERQLLLLQPRF